MDRDKQYTCLARLQCAIDITKLTKMVKVYRDGSWRLWVKIKEALTIDTETTLNEMIQYINYLKLEREKAEPDKAIREW